ncbi:unnamed protein product [Caenorhabditis bovis]|uniref:DUF7087 domain-containing protein n=1 Tax=Caenorhabditis bovis TaxID=2654633 RepID=A0A8S1F3Q0_9PELO|nr:unnamed protein product [Caenorhabditis bovis]
MADKLFARYDFPLLVNNSRIVQLLCTVMQLIFVYTESGSLSLFTFLFYSILIGMHVLHLARRWYYNIDGRYDMRQMLRDNEATLRIQYAVALFAPLVLGCLTYCLVTLNNGLIHTLFHLSTMIQVFCAFMQLACEFYEVIANQNKK